uniref:DUF6534 domain-containing protein n=1 Tax=Psilocybe cubensis TaxID=181762 RepID=A0A8H7XPA8_PSICU
MYIDLYHLSFSRDATRVKALVYITFILETLQTLLSTKTIFDAFVYGFLAPNLSSLDHIGNLWFVVPILGGSVACISQTFYAYRITVIGRYFKGAKYAAGIIALLALAQMAGAIAIGVEMFQAKLFSRFVDSKVKLTVGFWNGGGALCDIIIAISMTYLLLSSSNNGIQDTRQIVQRLVRLTIETGSLTACIAILNIVLTMLPGEPTYYQTTANVLSKMYANTMLVVLNSRMRFGQGYQGSQAEGFRYNESNSTQLIFSNTGKDMWHSVELST